MILVTVGTNEQPFDRLVRWAAALEVDEPLVVQHGSSRVPHGPGEWVDFLPFDELSERASAARAVVCHAGVGSIMLARRYGHRPIVVARRVGLGEAVDDHQLALALRLSQAGLVTVVHDEAGLRAALGTSGAAPVPRRPVSVRGADTLSAEVRDVLSGLGAARVSGRAA
jgi:UDP-N-acetylglucosamine transferase subunit ALG13